MAKHVLSLLLCFVILYTAAEVLGDESQQFRRVCYFTNWSCDLLIKEAHFCLSHIDVKLCSHLIYAFVGVNVTSRTLEPSRVDDKSHGDKKGRYILFNELKQRNPNLKTLLSVGGSSHSGNLDNVTSSASLRKEFAYNSAVYARKWGFDGLDLDWEYPDHTQKEALTLLVQDLRTAFNKEARESGQQELILSLAAPPSEDRVKSGYDVEKISQYVDMINLMVYDFHGAWGDITGFNSPLYPRSSDPRYSPKHCVKWTVNLWLTLGAPSRKINLGIAGYGQSFTLDIEDDTPNNTTLTNDTMTASKENGTATNQTLGDDPVISVTQRSQLDITCNTGLNCSTESNSRINFMENYENATYGVGSKAKGPGKPGRLRHLDGQLSYPEICEKIKHGGTLSWNDEQRVPFMVDGDQWVGFDDVRSIAEKVKWASENNLGGVMFWSLDLDDFKGDYCNQGRYPLLTAISDTVASLGYSLGVGHGLPNDTHNEGQLNSNLMYRNSNDDNLDSGRNMTKALDKAVGNRSNNLHDESSNTVADRIQTKDSDTSNQVFPTSDNKNNSGKRRNKGNGRRGKSQHSQREGSNQEDHLGVRSRPPSNLSNQNEHSNNDRRSRVHPSRSEANSDNPRRPDRRRQGRPDRRKQDTSSDHRVTDRTRQTNRNNQNGNKRPSENNFRRQRKPHRGTTSTTRPTSLSHISTSTGISGNGEHKPSNINQGRTSTAYPSSNPLDLFPHINVDDSDIRNDYYYYIAFGLTDPNSPVPSTTSTPLPTTTKKPRRKSNTGSKNSSKAKETLQHQSEISNLGKPRFYNSASQLSAKITIFVAALATFYFQGTKIA